MKPGLRREKTARTRPGRRFGASCAAHKLRSVVESGILAMLLLGVVISVVLGSSAMLLCAVVGAWISLAVIVGPRRMLDAGCAFMLLAVGIILVVDLATNGPASLLP